MSLGEYIKEKRKLKDWSQRDLAAASGISNAEISRIESGKRKEPSSSILKDIANALGVPVEELLQEAGIISSDASASSSDTASFSDPYVMPRDLTTEELDEVFQYIDYIRSKRK